MRLEAAVAVQAAVAGGAVIRRAIASAAAQTFVQKPDKSVVSQVDLASERAILELIRAAFPDDGIYAEESGAHAGRSGRTWVVDPLDGTSNFATGLGGFSVSIALLDGAAPVVGVVHAPLTLATTWAVRGGGAVHDGVAIAARPPTSPRLTVAIDVPYGGRDAARRARGALEPRCARVMENWSPALDYAALATGRLDAIVCMGAESEDKVAGLLVALEAGCPAVLLDDQFQPAAWEWRPFAPYVPWLAIGNDRATLDAVLGWLAGA